MHVVEVLRDGDASAALLAGALHDGTLSIEAVKSCLLTSGVAVRPTS